MRRGAGEPGREVRIMIITAAQFEALEAASAEHLVRRIGVFVDTHCDLSYAYDDSPALAHDDRRDAIRELVGRARGYGIHTERGFVQFAILGLGYSRRFDETPRVQEMLRDPRHLPEENLQRVLNAVVVAEARRA